LGRVWEPAADYNGCWESFKFKKRSLNSLFCLQRLSHQNRSLSRIVCRGQEGPKGSKGTLISRPIVDIYFFKQANVTARNRKEVVRKSKYS
jgi:hypothetical protein